jgi:thiol-disulfide isomerase/thioredoxin
MTKFYVYVCLGLVLCFSAQGRSKDSLFILDGKITGAKDGTKIELFYRTFKDGKWYKTLRSAVINNGRFSFSGKIGGATAANLCVPNQNAPLEVIYIEPCRMELEIDNNTPYFYKLSGSKIGNESLELRQKLMKLVKMKSQKLTAMEKLAKEMHSLKDDSNRDSLSNILRTEGNKIKLMNTAIDSIRWNYARSHKNSCIAADLLFVLAQDNGLIGIHKIKNVYDSLTDEVKSSLIGKLALQAIERRTSSMVGNIAPDFSRISSSGDTVRLSDYKNKNYVLLDFWASWCGPCLNEIPKVKQLYNKYKADGLVLISISSDDNRAAWLKDIDKNGMNEWPQILSQINDHERDDSLFNNNDLCELYSFDFLPSYLLLDKDGKIVARLGHINEEEIKQLMKK